MSNLKNLSDSFIFVNRNSGIKCVKMTDDLYEIGGNLVCFKKSVTDNNDFAGDFFNIETDFGPRKDSPVFYQHLQDGLLKQIPLSSEFGTLKMTNDGVWIDAQLDISRKYAEMVAKKYGVSVDQYLDAVNSIVKMAEGGILGWSSGVAGHQVESVKTSYGNYIKMWYLGSDASLTPNPAEFNTIPQLNNKVMPFKTFIDLQLQNPTLKMVVSSDITDQPEETKAGRVLSTANLNKLNEIQNSLNELISTANTGNNALTDKAPENDEGFSMSGEMKTGQIKCESCEERSVKFGAIEERLKNIPYSKIKMEMTDKYDVAWLLEDLGRVMWNRLEFIDTDAVAQALKDAADFIIELKNDSQVKSTDVTTDDEPEETVSETGKENSSETKSEKPFSEVFREGLDVFVN